MAQFSMAKVIHIIRGFSGHKEKGEERPAKSVASSHKLIPTYIS